MDLWIPRASINLRACVRACVRAPPQPSVLLRQMCHVWLYNRYQLSSCGRARARSSNWNTRGAAPRLEFPTVQIGFRISNESEGFRERVVLSQALFNRLRTTHQFFSGLTRPRFYAKGPDLSNARMNQRLFLVGQDGARETCPHFANARLFTVTQDTFLHLRLLYLKLRFGGRSG